MSLFQQTMALKPYRLFVHFFQHPITSCSCIRFSVLLVTVCALLRWWPRAFGAVTTQLLSACCYRMSLSPAFGCTTVTVRAAQCQNLWQRLPMGVNCMRRIRRTDTLILTVIMSEEGPALISEFANWTLYHCKAVFSLGLHKGFLLYRIGRPKFALFVYSGGDYYKRLVFMFLFLHYIIFRQCNVQRGVLRSFTKLLNNSVGIMNCQILCFVGRASVYNLVNKYN